MGAASGNVPGAILGCAQTLSLGKLLSEEVLQSSHSLLPKKIGKQIVQLFSHIIDRPSRVPHLFAGPLVPPG